MLSIRIDRDEIPHLAISWNEETLVYKQIAPTCPDCNGTGGFKNWCYTIAIDPDEPCGICDGKGWLTWREWLWWQRHKD